MGEIIKAYKGFNKDMTCTPTDDIKFQYEEGKEYETASAECCESGFHGCECPLDCFKYYQPTKSIYHEVEQSGKIDKSGNDSKIASTKIKIGASISIAGIIQAQIDFVRNKIDKAIKEDKSSETGGNYSNIAGGNGSNIAGGNYSNIAGGKWSNLAGGDYSNLAGGKWSNIAGGNGSNIAGGDYSNLAGGKWSNIAGWDGSNLAGGDYSNLAGGKWSNIAGGKWSNIAGGDGSNIAGGDGSNLAGGDYSNLAGGDGSNIVSKGTAEVKNQGIAVVRGNGRKAKGGMGSIILLVEGNKSDYDIKEWKAFQIDGETYKPDTWYKIENGEVVEAEESEA